jgi:DNA-binding winged helix-turn-helix (wHTH) protein
MEPLRPNSVVRFGTFEVSLQSGEVRKAGLRIRVQQQPMKLLEILVERPAEVVTREELRSRVWPNESFGGFDQALNIAIGKLRNALGDSAENPRFIETLPKRGYRFIADVSVVDATPAQKGPNLWLEICRQQSPRISSKAPGWRLYQNAGCGRRVGSSSPWRSS